MKIIVGIGNPGKKYQNTRHNVGYMVVDRFSERMCVRVAQGGAYSLIGEGTHFGESVVLAKPVTFVNRTGMAAAQLLKNFKGSPDSLLVVCDDFNLPLGKVRFRKGGGDGGHKGLRSVNECLGITDFPRIRVGIGTVPEHASAVDFVLGTWEGQEQEHIFSIIGKICDSLSIWMRTGRVEEIANFLN